MIGLIALLNVTQPLPWLDRSWINHQARREMLVAAGASSFDVPPRLRLVLPVREPATRPLRIGVGGPSGM
jgi:hypothetical protein